MIRLVLAAAALALTAHAAHARPHPASRAVAVRARIVAGNPQTARAFVDTAASKYTTDFPVPLVVAVNATPLEGEVRRVRFRCAPKGCALAPAEQGDNIDNIQVVYAPKRAGRADANKRVVDPSAKDAYVVDGRATIHIAIDADRPDATYTVTATPLVQKGERAVPAEFTLISR
jgi:hypothetical protein